MFTCSVEDCIVSYIYTKKCGHRDRFVGILFLPCFFSFFFSKKGEGEGGREGEGGWGLW